MPRVPGARVLFCQDEQGVAALEWLREWRGTGQTMGLSKAVCGWRRLVAVTDMEGDW
jgi:hypothetical protein